MPLKLIQLEQELVNLFLNCLSLLSVFRITLSENPLKESEPLEKLLFGNVEVEFIDLEDFESRRFNLGAPFVKNRFKGLSWHFLR